MNPDRALLVAFAVAVLAAGAVTLPAADVADATTDGAEGLLSPGVTEASAAVQANNTTVRHEHPEEADEDGDVDEIQRWLSGRLGERLTESSIHLSQGEYELARTVVDEEYRRQLGKYVDVAGETDDESDDRASDQFDRARDRQEEYATSVQSYRETREEYEEAKEDGDEARARELARELERTAAEVNETGDELADSYTRISNETDVDLTEAERNVEAVQENVSEQQATIRAEEFVETELTAAAGDDRASFLDPLLVTGRLTAANGTTLSDRTIVLDAGGRTVETTTDADGEFSIEFRPTLAPTGDVTVAVRYVPAAESVYLGSTATVETTIEQVRPTVDLEEHTASASFGDPVTASGFLGVDDVVASEVPLVLEVDGVPVAETETRDDGSFAFDGALPASIPTGERDLRVRLALEDRALAAANASSSVTVTETGTAMTLGVTGIDGRTLDVGGRLETVDGEPIGDRTVALAIDDETVTTTSTDSNGAFATSVPIPSSIVADGENVTVTVSARFDGAGTNLESAAAERDVTVTVPGDVGQVGDATGDRGSIFGLGVPWWGWLAVPIAVVVALGGLYRVRDHRDEDGAEQEPTDPGGPIGGTGTVSEPVSLQLLELARDRLNGGRADEAVQAGYGAVRRRLEEVHDLASPRTHWEFYRACRTAELDADRTTSLRRLTELYERAAFTPDPVSAEDAEDAVGTASEIASSPGSTASSDD